MTKRIVLCADDYGQAEAVSGGILDLLTLGRLSAVSCMVNQAYWPAAATGLVPFESQVDIGLHLNLTDGKPLSALYREREGQELMGLPRLLWRTMVRPGSLSRVAVVAEINAQLDAFTEAMGFMPCFIDGHQHVHHLPVVSAALFEVYEERLRPQRSYLRAVSQPWRMTDIVGKGLKNAVIHYTGGGRFARRLDGLRIAHNTTFSGIYDFGCAADYRAYFQRFLQESADSGLIMCHPGRQADDQDDPIRQARFYEYQYFKSADFKADCEQFGIEIVPLFPVLA